MVVNPAMVDPEHLAMLRFLGELFGLAIRSKTFLNLNLVRHRQAK